MNGQTLCQAAGIGLSMSAIVKGDKVVMGLQIVPTFKQKRTKKGGKVRRG
jgi:hypothetical protein